MGLDRRSVLVAFAAWPAFASPFTSNSTSAGTRRKVSRVLTRDEMGTILKPRHALLADLTFASRTSAPARQLGYHWAPVKKYLTEHCAGGNDCPDDQFPLDCTHFVCHSLNKAGVYIRTPTQDCSSGLGIRVNDLAETFFNSVMKYSNVLQLTSHADTREGDFCFIPKWFGLQKEHAMVLADTATAVGAKVWAHTNEHCGEYVDFKGESCAYYRINDT